VNRLDVVAGAIEHAIPSSRLLFAFQLTVSEAARHEVAAAIAMYRPTEVVTGGGRLILDGGGITGIGLHSADPVRVTWEEVAGHLASVITRAGPTDFEAAYQASLKPTTPHAIQDLADARASLAYHTSLDAEAVAARNRLTGCFPAEDALEQLEADLATLSVALATEDAADRPARGRRATAATPGR